MPFDRCTTVFLGALGLEQRRQVELVPLPMSGALQVCCQQHHPLSSSSSLQYDATYKCMHLFVMQTSLF